MPVNSVIFQGDASPWNGLQKHILDLEIDRIKTMPHPGSILQKCQFLSFWPFLAKFRILNKNPQIWHCSKMFHILQMHHFFSTFFPTCFEKKGVFSRKKSLLHLKKSTFTICISKGAQAGSWLDVKQKINCWSKADKKTRPACNCSHLKKTWLKKHIFHFSSEGSITNSMSILPGWIV